LPGLALAELEALEVAEDEQPARAIAPALMMPVIRRNL
jgi:hypothetical protein